MVGWGMLGLFVIAIGIFLLPFAFPTPPRIVTRFQSTRLFSPNDDGRREVARVSIRIREAGVLRLDVTADGRIEVGERVSLIDPSHTVPIEADRI